MKRTTISILTFAMSIIAMVSFAQTSATDSYKIVLVPMQHGVIKITPAIPADSMVKKGAVLTVEAIPEPGYVQDVVYYYNNIAALTRNYFEFTTAKTQITIDQSKVIGASFIEKSALKGFKVVQDVVYAQPGVKKLKYDVYTPEGAKNLPCIVAIHGGGWKADNEDMLNGFARGLASSGRYVVFSVDYRWLGKADGDATPNSMANLIEDIYGALGHIQEHAKQYGADPTRIALTGVSAGGHLSASATTMVNRLGDEGFGVKTGVYQYMPVYLPKNKSVAQFKNDITAAIKVVAPSYGFFSGGVLKGFVADEPDPSLALTAVSPINNIQNVKDRAVPQYLIRGTKDPYVNNESVQVYADALKAAGQKVVYENIEGAGHGFFDWKPDDFTKTAFTTYGIPYTAKILAFFDEIFYPGK
jgi:acetyl esterase